MFWCPEWCAAWPAKLRALGVLGMTAGDGAILLRKRSRCQRVELQATTTVLTMTPPHPNPLPPGERGDGGAALRARRGFFDSEWCAPSKDKRGTMGVLGMTEDELPAVAAGRRSVPGAGRQIASLSICASSRDVGMGREARRTHHLRSGGGRGLTFPVVWSTIAGDEEEEMARRKTAHASHINKGIGGAGPNIARAVVVITCVAAIGAVARGFGEPVSPAHPPTEPSPVSGSPVTELEEDPSAGVPEASDPEEMATPGPARIGIVAGHWGFDSGAVCDDGLEEVQVNLEVAQRVVQSLRALGYNVDLLEEYDQRLRGYQAEALVSIHADSCQPFPKATPPPTGFKVASVVDSYVPEEEQRLVNCLYQEYGARTGLPAHDTSITGHMTQYHMFYEIDPWTPGAIIETGFLWLDRELLTQRPDLVAQGVVDGILCFVEGE